MIPWELLDTAQIPGGGGEMTLHRRGEEFSIRVDGVELMNSRVHGSEETLAELACGRMAGLKCPRMLIGGLGMGYTTAAALKHLGPGANIVVSELVPAVVQWNRAPLAGLAGAPLGDKRVTVREDDVALILKEEQLAYDAVLLDVDNGPDGLTRKGNDWLYSLAGLHAAHAALRPGGVLAVWSAGADPAFTKRLRQAGFNVTEQSVRARGKRGSRHTIWMAVRKG